MHSPEFGSEVKTKFNKMGGKELHAQTGQFDFKIVSKASWKERWVCVAAYETKLHLRSGNFSDPSIIEMMDSKKFLVFPGCKCSFIS